MVACLLAVSMVRKVLAFAFCNVQEDVNARVHLSLVDFTVHKRLGSTHEINLALITEKAIVLVEEQIKISKRPRID